MTKLLTCLLLASWWCFTPAPLPRRERQPPRLPVSCVMRWAGVPYDTLFLPGGKYRAVSRRSPLTDRWEGTWELQGRKLTVRERHEGAAHRSYHVWSTWLDERLRRRAEGGHGPDVVLTEEGDG